MKVETTNLKRLKTLAENFENKEKKLGVSKQYIIELFNKNGVEKIEIDGTAFYDITKLPTEIREKIKL